MMIGLKSLRIERNVKEQASIDFCLFDVIFSFFLNNIIFFEPSHIIVHEATINLYISACFSS